MLNTTLIGNPSRAVQAVLFRLKYCYVNVYTSMMFATGAAAPQHSLWLWCACCSVVERCNLLNKNTSKQVYVCKRYVFLLRKLKAFFCATLHISHCGCILHTLITHWGRVTHICVSKLTITRPDNGLSPGRRQTIIWTSAGILLIRTLVTNFGEILIKIDTFSLKKMHLKCRQEDGSHLVSASIW